MHFLQRKNCILSPVAPCGLYMILWMCAKMADNRFAYKHCWLCPINLLNIFSGNGFGKWKNILINPTSHSLIESVQVWIILRRTTLQWRHNGCDNVSNHQPRECLLSRLIRRKSKKTPKFRVTGLCAGNSPETSEFPTQRASNAEKVSGWWRHHAESGLRWCAHW